MFVCLFQTQLLIILSDPVAKRKVQCIQYILGDPGADSGGEGKSKGAEKYRARRKVKNGEKSPWGQCFLVPIRSQNSGDHLELVW